MSITNSGYYTGLFDSYQMSDGQKLPELWAALQNWRYNKLCRLSGFFLDGPVVADSSSIIFLKNSHKINGVGGCVGDIEVRHLLNVIRV